MVAEKYGDLTPGRLVEELCRIGVIDHTLCKVLAVRRYVEELTKSGLHGKVEAMWIAAEHFCATYEYVRKCMYYYTDVNI
jgi:ribosomal protein L17